MLYACSILYKTKLPFVLVFNKTDVVSHQFAVEWMTDFEAFQAALQEDTSYMGGLVSSMCLVLEEFYKGIRVAGVSAVTGAGMDEFFQSIEEARQEYERYAGFKYPASVAGGTLIIECSEYKPEIERILLEKQKREEQRRNENLNKLMHDMSLEKGKAVNFDGRWRLFNRLINMGSGGQAIDNELREDEDMSD